MTVQIPKYDKILEKLNSLPKEEKEKKEAEFLEAENLALQFALIEGLDEVKKKILEEQLPLLDRKGLFEFGMENNPFFLKHYKEVMDVILEKFFKELDL